MRESQLVMHEEDFKRIQVVIGRLTRDANAKGVFVVDKAGQLIGESGELQGIDSTSLASLTARLDSITVELRAGNGTAGKILTDTELYEQMNRVSVSLRELLEDVKENPKRYINLKIF